MVQTPQIGRKLAQKRAQKILGTIRQSEPSRLVVQDSDEARRKALAALMYQWNAEDATNDSVEIARREADWQEFEANLQANRFTLPVPEV